MPERNLELMRRFVEAFNARDARAMIALCDSNIEYHAALGTTVGGGVFHGHDGLMELFRAIEDVWDELRIEPEAYFEAGEHALVFAAQYGRGRQSGAEVAMPMAGVVRWHDGLIVYVKGYSRREDALRDLGVSEHELEPIPP